MSVSQPFPKVRADLTPVNRWRRFFFSGLTGTRMASLEPESRVPLRAVVRLVGNSKKYFLVITDDTQMH